MQIILNGSAFSIEDRLTLHELVKQLNCTTNCAVAVNMAVIPHSRYHDYWLCANDKVEIVTAFQGG